MFPCHPDEWYQCICNAYMSSHISCDLRDTWFCGCLLISLSRSLSQRRSRVAWWVQGMSAVGRFSVSITTPVKSKGCTTSVSLCCTTQGAMTHRWAEARQLNKTKKYNGEYNGVMGGLHLTMLLYLAKATHSVYSRYTFTKYLDIVQ